MFSVSSDERWARLEQAAEKLSFLLGRGFIPGANAMKSTLAAEVRLFTVACKLSRSQGPEGRPAKRQPSPEGLGING